MLLEQRGSFRYSYIRQDPDEVFSYPNVSLTFRRIALKSPVTGDRQPRFYRTGAEFFNPRWSFDGTRIAYSSDQNNPGDRDVFVGQVSFDHAPTFTALATDYELPAGTSFTLELNATDPDGEAITYQDVALYRPSGATFSGNTFHWSNPTPEGTEFFVVFRALDPSGGLDNRVVRLHVAPAGGGCPYVDTRTAAGWQVENSILARSLTGTLALDAYRLKAAPQIGSGRVQIRLRENEQEYTTLDQVRLAAVDHLPGVQAFPSGSSMLIGTRVPAYRVTTQSGEDITSLVNGSSDSYFVGAPGETLTVQMYGSTPAGALGAQRTENGGPGEIDPGDKGGEGGTRAREATQDATIQSTAVDATILGSTGILVQGPDGQGGWRTIETRYPRAQFDGQVLDSLPGDMRLIFIGRHRLRFVGHIQIADAATPQLLSPLSARHSRLGDQLLAVSGAGGTTTALTPGDTLTLEFAAPPLPAGKVRDWVLLSSGVYTSMKPGTQQAAGAERLPTQFALLQNRPNPFAGSTVIGFELPRATSVRLDVFDLQGRLVRRLADRAYEAGRWSVGWDQRGSNGARFQPGVYLYRIQAGAFTAQRKMIVLP